MAAMTPFSSYLSGQSWLHRLDTRVKLLLLATYLTSIFLVGSWLGLLLLAVLLVVGFQIAGISWLRAGRGLTPLIVILLFTILANALGWANLLPPAPPLVPWWSPPGWDLGLSTPDFWPWIGNFGLKPGGLLRGLYLALRIILLFGATALLTYTSPLVALTDALVALLRPLQTLGVPTEDVAMIFSIALRFMVLVSLEIDQIQVAQRSRGAVFGRGGPLRRLRAWLPVLVPLFVKLFRRADQLAAAMETRCYQGTGRTHRRQIRLSAVTWLGSLLAAGLLIGAGVLL
ncbi:MAG: energy-coupling factor transporter transmembrane protein EcfT [Actinomycetia bacterium]|nr:energy-coupling factor transporter transmembrane protein EcfT [Actinomycetes bacterium]